MTEMTTDELVAVSRNRDNSDEFGMKWQQNHLYYWNVIRSSNNRSFW